MTPAERLALEVSELAAEVAKREWLALPGTRPAARGWEAMCDRAHDRRALLAQRLAWAVRAYRDAAAPTADPAEQERAAVVAWLRDRAKRWAARAAGFGEDDERRVWLDIKAREMGAAADAVERGDHRREP